jgi:hypothetical protein
VGRRVKFQVINKYHIMLSIYAYSPLDDYEYRAVLCGDLQKELWNQITMKQVSGDSFGTCVTSKNIYLIFILGNMIVSAV